MNTRCNDGIENTKSISPTWKRTWSRIRYMPLGPCAQADNFATLGHYLLVGEVGLRVLDRSQSSHSEISVTVK